MLTFHLPTNVGMAGMRNDAGVRRKGSNGALGRVAINCFSWMLGLEYLGGDGLLKPFGSFEY